jgi:hypothetical protein
MNVEKIKTLSLASSRVQFSLSAGVVHSTSNNLTVISNLKAHERREKFKNAQLSLDEDVSLSDDGEF